MNAKIRKILQHGGATLAAGLISTSVSAGIITYDLTNKAPGAENPPDYGLRLDQLLGSVDSPWTFDFNLESTSNVTMKIDTDNKIVDIFGQVTGGRDSGTSWATGTKAVWELKFVYDFGVVIDDASTGEFHIDYDSSDGDVGAGNKDSSGSEKNFGYLKLLDTIDLDGGGTDENKVIGLADFHGAHLDLNGANPDFEGWLVDTDGFDGTSTDLDVIKLLTFDRNGACCKDFGANVNEVPEPGTVSLIALGLIGFGMRRRKKGIQSLPDDSGVA